MKEVREGLEELQSSVVGVVMAGVLSQLQLLRICNRARKEQTTAIEQ